MTTPENNIRYHHRKWLLKAPLGLVLIGFGVCLVAEGAMRKYGGAETWDWVLYGTLALAVLNAGVSVFGGAVVHRVHVERLRETSS